MDKKNVNLKKALYKSCVEFVDQREETINEIITSSHNALTSETKSSAGDKHETGRAMLQLEREKAGHQLAEIQKLKIILSKVKHTKPSSTIGLGSLVCTTQANYYIAISAGVIQINNEVYYAISSGTPIGQLLVSKQVGDQIKFRNQEFIITTVL